MGAAATTAINSAITDANTVGALVVGAVAVIVGVSIIVSMMRKA